MMFSIHRIQHIQQNRQIHQNHQIRQIYQNHQIHQNHISQFSSTFINFAQPNTAFDTEFA